MQLNLLWSGRENLSLENCLVNTTESGTEINSTVIGMYEKQIFRVDYLIRTNPDWETVFFEISSRHNNQQKTIRLESDGKDNWFDEGKEAIQFSGCIDIDIPLTPFTNTLPINRLKLAQNESREIRVIYLDLLGQGTRVVRQKYTRLSESEYHYENVPNDFEASILVDEFGFVVDYPSLFFRTAAMETNYH